MREYEDIARPVLERVEREVGESKQEAGDAAPLLLKASSVLAAMLKEIPPSRPVPRRLSDAHAAVIGDVMHTLAQVGKTKAPQALMVRVTRWCADLLMLEDNLSVFDEPL
jgi:hypothetical protein